MGTAFAGIVRVPLTSVIMIFEMTRDYSIIVPLMISNLVSFYISFRLQRQPIYDCDGYSGMLLPFARKGIAVPLTCFARYGESSSPTAHAISGVHARAIFSAGACRTTNRRPPLCGRPCSSGLAFSVRLSRFPTLPRCMARTQERRALHGLRMRPHVSHSSRYGRYQRGSASLDPPCEIPV